MDSTAVHRGDLRARVARMAREKGLPATARELGLSRYAVATFVAGFPSRNGTLALIREKLAQRPAARAASR